MSTESMGTECICWPWSF